CGAGRPRTIWRGCAGAGQPGASAEYRAGGGCGAEEGGLYAGGDPCDSVYPVSGTDRRVAGRITVCQVAGDGVECPVAGGASYAGACAGEPDTAGGGRGYGGFRCGGEPGGGAGLSFSLPDGER